MKTFVSLKVFETLVFVVGSCFSIYAFAAEQIVDASAAPKKTEFASDNNKFDGDLLRLRVDVPGFKKVGDESTNYTATKGSKLIVSKDLGDSISVRFTSMGSDTCVGTCVNENTQYVINKETLTQYDYRRTGVTFGGLIVPFKFYLGADKKISASSTIAPYIGYSNTAVFGLTLTPILSAGLGLVPVTNPATNETDTKPALSTAIGLVVTSSKNEQFNSGLLIGKDYLSKTDRNNDPIVSKAWLSLYVGYKL